MRRVTRQLVVIIDADGSPMGLLPRMLVRVDRGKFMRTLEGLSSVIGEVFEIDQIVRFNVGLYTQFLFRCRTDGMAGQFSCALAARPRTMIWPCA